MARPLVHRPVPRASRNAPVVVSVGGSVLFTGAADAAYLEQLATAIRRWATERPLVVTTGGGRTAREYIEAGRALGLTEVELDELGIDVTRLHARLLASRIGPPAPLPPPSTIAEAVREAHRFSPVILGGTEPGHTTDGVAALIAVRLRATRVVNATSVAGLYDHDPAVDPNARRRDRIDWPAFQAIVRAEVPGAAGQRFVFDRLGADALARAQIPLRIVDGRDLPNLEAAVVGAAFQGTEVGGDGGQSPPSAVGRSRGRQRL